MLKRLNSKLERIFDQDAGFNLALDQAVLDAKKNFEPLANNRHLENLSYIFTQEITTANVSLLFSQISAYFEMCFLFQKNNKNTTYKIKEAMVYTKKINQIEIWPSIRLPQIPLYKVFKTPAHHLLKNFNMQDLDQEKRMNSYLIRISNDHILMFTTQTADPWTKLRVEVLQQTLMKINFNL